MGSIYNDGTFCGIYVRIYLALCHKAPKDIIYAWLYPILHGAEHPCFSGM